MKQWGNGVKLTSAYFRYLKKFIEKSFIVPHKLVVNGKSNTKYSITENGKKILNEALSFNKNYE